MLLLRIGTLQCYVYKTNGLIGALLKFNHWFIHDQLGHVNVVSLVFRKYYSNSTLKVILYYFSENIWEVCTYISKYLLFTLFVRNYTIFFLHYKLNSWNIVFHIHATLLSGICLMLLPWSFIEISFSFNINILKNVSLYNVMSGNFFYNWEVCIFISQYLLLTLFVWYCSIFFAVTVWLKCICAILVFAVFGTCLFEWWCHLPIVRKYIMQKSLITNKCQKSLWNSQVSLFFYWYPFTDSRLQCLGIPHYPTGIPLKSHKIQKM